VKRIVWISVVAILIGLVGAPANAQSADGLRAVEAFCVAQGGTWEETGIFGFPTCRPVGSLLYYHDPAWSGARTGLVAAEQLCQAAGYSGVFTFGKGIWHEKYGAGVAVDAWVCA
jgi:hypothetical protein